MKKTILVIGLALSAAGCTLAAQQPMPDMPGMNMPKAPQQQAKPAAKPVKPKATLPQEAKPEPQKANSQKQTMPDMPGMDMSMPMPGMPNKNAASPETMPEDLKSMGRDRGNKKAQEAAASVEEATRQQAGQKNKMPGEASDQGSIKVPIQELQEPEALELRTGTDMPAPELLGDVVKREPMTLEQFLALADKANPTLAQAQLNVDRSAQQARQVSLPPDPIVGYNGDHIRGGQYHGGEQGAFFTQEFVLGHKLALRRDLYRAEGRSNQYALEV